MGMFTPVLPVRLTPAPETAPLTAILNPPSAAVEFIRTPLLERVTVLLDRVVPATARVALLVELKVPLELTIVSMDVEPMRTFKLPRTRSPPLVRVIRA